MVSYSLQKKEFQGLTCSSTVSIQSTLAALGFDLQRAISLMGILESSRGLDKKQSGNNYTSKVKVSQKYSIIGFISSGTYGRVYKAMERNPRSGTSTPEGAAPTKELFAIKK